MTGPALLEEASRSGGLTTAGTTIMLVSVAAILTGLVWCYRRLLGARGGGDPPDRPHHP